MEETLTQGFGTQSADTLNQGLAALLGIVGVCAAIAAIALILRWFLNRNENDGQAGELTPKITRIGGSIAAISVLVGGAGALLATFKGNAGGEVSNAAAGSTGWQTPGSPGADSTTLGDYLNTMPNKQSWADNQIDAAHEKLENALDSTSLPDWVKGTLKLGAGLNFDFAHGAVSLLNDQASFEGWLEDAIGVSIPGTDEKLALTDKDGKYAANSAATQKDSNKLVR